MIISMRLLVIRSWTYPSFKSSGARTSFFGFQRKSVNFGTNPWDNFQDFHIYVRAKVFSPSLCAYGVSTRDAQRLFFSSKRLLAYTKRYNTCSTRFVTLPIWVLSYHLYSNSLLGLSYLVVTTDMFFSLLKRIAATERPFEVQRGSLGFLGGGGQRRKTVLAISSKKICPKCIFLGTSGVIWGDLRTFWSDF